MKNLLDYRCLVSLNGEEFADTSVWSHLIYSEPRETEEKVWTNFEEAAKAIRNGEVMNAETDRTLFRNRPPLSIRYADLAVTKNVTEKQFKSLRVRNAYEEVTRSYDIMALAKMLPAEDFCEWLKDHGITKWR